MAKVFGVATKGFAVCLRQLLIVSVEQKFFALTQTLIISLMSYITQLYKLGFDTML